MNLGVKDAAGLLSVSEKTIYRWIKQEIVPAYKINEQYRFNRAELLEWATSRRISVPPEALDEAEASTQPLPTATSALESGGIFYRIDGRKRREVLENVVRHLRLPDEVDRDYLLKVLIARERLASTGVGNGIAIAHPRNPVLLHIQRPTITLCFLEEAVDWRALDRQPVNILFTLVAPTLRIHLHLLSLLGFALRDEEFLQVLLRAGSREEIFASLRRFEERLNA
ncbi:MAG: PTS sugar transporter subunit IIA [Desulfuromonadales bacterium]